MIFKMGELFSGPGGLGLGAMEAKIEKKDTDFRIEHQWAYDIDPAACQTYIANICPNRPDSVQVADVRELDIDSTDKIDAFSFGFPCNDYSNIGEKKGLNGEFGPLYTYGVHVLKKHQPKWFLAENVGGLQSSDQGRTFQLILKDLEDAGYEVTPHLYKFEEYGVPQKRHRIIIVGIRKDQGLKFKIPAPTITDPKKYKTVKDAFQKDLFRNKKRDVESIEYNNIKTKHPNSVIERLRHIPPGENAWYEKLPKELQLNVKGARLSNIYRRLKEDEAAYTVTGSGGGGTHMYHHIEPRALTNRERARLQTFPDDFIFKGTKEEIRKQIGMAVPPLGAKFIYEAILKTFAGIKYDSISGKWDE